MEDSLKKRYAIKLLSSFVNGIINIILVAIVPKALGPVAFGHFSYLQQFFSQFIAFIDAGTSTAFFTKLSARQERKTLIKFYFFISLILLCILLFFVYLIHIFNYESFFLPNIPGEYIIYAAWFGFFTWLNQIYIKISDAYAITVSVELIKIFHRILSLALLVIIINYFLFDLYTYFIYHFVVLVLFICIVSVVFVHKGIFSKKLPFLEVEYKKLTKEFFDYCSPLFIFNTVAILVALFDIWLLQKVSGSIETGYYGLAYSIASMCLLFTGAMTPIITREFAKSFEENNLENIRKLYKQYVPMLYAIATYFSVFIAFQSEVLLDIFTDSKFKEAYLVLVIMAFYPMHQTYGQLSSAIFLSSNKTREYKNIGLVTSFMGVIVSLYLILYLELGAIGFAIKMILIQIIGVNIQLFFNAKQLNLPLVYFIKNQVYVLFIFLVLAYVSSFMLVDDKIMEFFLQGIIYTLLSIGFVYFIPSIFGISKENIQNIVTRFKGVK